MAQPDLHRIEVETYTEKDPVDGHTEISIHATTWRYLKDQSVDSRDIWAANIHVAGIIGRVVASLASDIHRSAKTHQCSDNRTAYGCFIYTDALLRPGEDLGSSPTACLYIPTEETEDWLDLVRGRLNGIALDVDALAAWEPLLVEVATPEAKPAKPPRLRSVS